MLNKSIRNWWSARTGRARTESSNKPDSPEAQAALDRRPVHSHLERARELHAQGRHREALEHFERAAKLAPDDPEVLLEQGGVHAALGELTEAHDCYQLAAAHAPGNAAAWLGLARTLRKAGEAQNARAAVERAARIDPSNAAVWFEAAVIYGGCDDLGAAAGAYRRGLALEENNAAGWANLGLLYLSRLGDASEAQRCFERALQLEPANVGVQANLGLALDEQGRTRDAVAYYEKLLAANPDEPELRWNRGLALLAAGEYGRGWDDYEMRNALKRGRPPREFPFPAWQGDPLPPGDSLLVYGEQGVGDEIMFASCVPGLLDRGIDCVIECDMRLAGLFARSFPGARIHGAPRDGDRSWLARYPEIRVQCGIGSLPRFMRRSLSDFAGTLSYLKPEERCIKAWRQRLARADSSRLVGIAWRGGTRTTRQELRTAALAELTPLLEMPGLTFVSLQRGGTEEIAKLPPAVAQRILDFGAELDDMEATAALCGALDHVVSVDNSLAHIAGALGRPTSILLSYSADWRWVRGQSTSAWYPTARLYRQPAPGAWPPVVVSVCAGLREHLGSARPGN